MSQPKTTRRHRVRRMSERRRLTVTAITAMLALVTVVICALSGVFNFHKGSERILPNLVGQTEESAKAQLAELDAEPSITYENSSETKGIVIRQDVNEGTQLKHRQTVAFVVSLGPKEQPVAPEDTPVAIPSFVGLTLEQAQATDLDDPGSLANPQPGGHPGIGWHLGQAQQSGREGFGDVDRLNAVEPNAFGRLGEHAPLEPQLAVIDHERGGPPVEVGDHQQRH